LPRIDNIFDNLRSSKIFTTLDLRSGYHQIQMDPASIPLTAFRMRYGLFEFLVFPFGLCNAPAAFMNLINDVLRPFIDRFVCAYLDDILIYSKTKAKHLAHLRHVLRTLREHKLYAKLSKCEFGRTSVDFLGHIVSPNGFELENGKTESIRVWPTPKSKKDVQSFLCIVKFYWCSVRDMAAIAKPPTDLTGNVEFAWTEAHEDSFRALKSRVASAPVPRSFDPTVPVIVSTDASGCALGAVLEQDDGMGRRPVAFFSKKLKIHEQRYTIRERELLAIVQAIRHWRCHLHGRSFLVFTDHESLRYLRTQEKLNDRQLRWMEMLEQYDFQIEPVPGPKNAVADALSRKGANVEPRARSKAELLDRVLRKALPMTTQKPLTTSDRKTTKEPLTTSEPNTTKEPLPTSEPKTTKAPENGPSLNNIMTFEMDQKELSALKSEYQADPEFSKLYKDPVSPYRIDQRLLLRGDLTCIPAGTHRLVALQDHHDVPKQGHMGVRKTTKALVDRFYWKSLRQDAQEFVRTCDPCQRKKSRTESPLGHLQPLELPMKRWASVSMDFISPLPKTSRGHTGLLVVVDRLSKMIRLAPTEPNASAPYMAQLFYDHVYRSFGLPKSIISNRDPVSMSKFWRALMDKMDVRLRPSSAYYPQTDEQTEIMNKKVEELLRCFVDHNQANWDLLLTDVEVAYNQSTNSVTTYTPFYMVYGFNPRTVPFDVLRTTNDKVPAAADWLSSQHAAHQTATDAIRRANAYCSISP